MILIKNNSEKIKINDKLDEESDSSSDLSDILAEDESDDFYNVYYNEINNLYNYIKEKNKRKKKGTQLVKQKKDIENSYIASLTKFRLACSVSSFKPIIPEEFIKNFYTTNSTDVQGALIHLFQVSPKIKVRLFIIHFFMFNFLIYFFFFRYYIIFFKKLLKMVKKKSLFHPTILNHLIR